MKFVQKLEKLTEISDKKVKKKKKIGETYE